MPKKVKNLRKANVRRKQKSAVQQAREQEYKKIRVRVQHRMSEYRTQGYDVSGVKVPAIPKRITEGSIRALSKITPEYIRKRSIVPTAIDITTGEVTKSISGEEYYQEKQKTSRRKAIETRRRRKTKSTQRKISEQSESGSKEHYDKGEYDEYDYSEAPHIGDLMKEKIEGLIRQYRIENSDLANRIQSWLDQADNEGTIDRLSQLSSDMLEDLEEDFRYTAQGKIPKFDGTNALHWALTGNNLSAKQWRDIQEGYETDFGADQFDEESFFGDTDDEDDY